MQTARHMLQVLLAVQAAAASGIAALLHVQFKWSMPAAAATAIASIILVRALIFTNNFFLSASARSITPDEFRPGLIGWLRLWWEEFAASMLQTSWYGPRGKARQVIFDNHAMPVLLLHGYGCNSAYWTRLSHRLDAARISHATVDLEPVTGDIDDYVEQVERAVDDLRAATGATDIAIVAHSMGGLVARAWLRKHGGDRLRQLITLGSPHHGTVLANFGVGANAMQMRRSRTGEASAWLRALDGAEPAALRARITSIYSHQDNIVSPQNSSCLDGARVIAFGGVGHVALGHNRRVLDCVLVELQRGQNRSLAGKLAP